MGGPRRLILRGFDQQLVDQNVCFRLKDIKNGVFRRASTSNALPTDIEFDPAATRRFSVITQDEYERKLHTTTAHLDFRSFDWTEEL